MSALEEPSRAATRSLRSLVVPRHRRSDPAPNPSYGLSRCSRAREVRFTEGPGSFHRPLAKRSHLPLSEKMEERPETPSVVSNSLPASADSRGVSATRARRLSASDRVDRHLSLLRSRVTFPHRFARTLDFIPAPLRRAPGTLRRGVLTALRCASLRGRSAAAPRVSGWRGLRRAGSSSYGTSCDETWSASLDAFDRLLLPNHSTTNTRTASRSRHLFEARASPLRSGLAPRVKETGGPGVSRRRIR